MSERTRTSRQLERHIKGISNHRRIDILLLIAKRGEVTLDEISSNLNCNFKTISGHTHRLVQAGLINKKHIGRNVMHSLSPYGKIFFRFLKSF